MTNKQSRFLRDNVLENMLSDIQSVSNKLENKEIPSFGMQNSLKSLLELYQTNKLVLERLEKSIYLLRQQDAGNDVIEPIAEAASHIQMGLTEIHNSLKKDFDELHTTANELRRILED